MSSGFTESISDYRYAALEDRSLALFSGPILSDPVMDLHASIFR